MRTTWICQKICGRDLTWFTLDQSKSQSNADVCLTLVLEQLSHDQKGDVLYIFVEVLSFFVEILCIFMEVLCNFVKFCVAFVCYLWLFCVSV